MKGKITCNRYEKSSLLPSKGILPTLIDDEEYQRNNAINAENSRRSTVVRIVTDSDSDDKALVVGGSNQGSSKLCYADRRRNSGVSSSVSYFHLYLCLGMMGFVVFWLVLMLRIYLPEAYWTWSYIWWPLTMMQKKKICQHSNFCGDCQRLEWIGYCWIDQGWIPAAWQWLYWF